MSETRAAAVPRRRADAAAALGLLAFAVLLLSPYLLVWPAPLIYPESDLGTDLPREIWPLAAWITDSFAQSGVLALWRPYLLSGAPLIGHPVAPVLYPPNWLLLILPTAPALNALAALHLWWAGLGLYLYLRLALGARRASAFIAAALFAFAPKWLAHLSGGHWPTLTAIVWWPWAWLAFDRFWAARRAHWIVLAGVALAAQALNHGTYFALGLLWLGVATLARLGRWPGRAALLTALGAAASLWAGLLLIAAGLALGQLWPLAELLPYTNRGGLSLAEAAFGSLPPALLSSVLFPAELKFPEWFIYPGAGLIGLAAWSWAHGWSRRERTWLGVAAIGALMSLGVNTPVYELLYRWMPGFSLFRNPTRWWLLTLMALAVLAAHGLEAWFNRSAARPRRLKVLIGLGGSVYLIAGALELIAPMLLPFDVWPGALALLAGSALLSAKPSRGRWLALLVVTFAEVAWVSATLLRPEIETRLVPAGPVIAPLERAAQSGQRSLAPYEPVPAPALVVHRLRAADGYDPFQLAAYAGLVGRALGCEFAGYAVAVPATQASPEAARACPEVQPHRGLLGLLNVRYLLLPHSRPWTEQSPALTDDTWAAYDLGPGLGRAFGVGQWQTAPADECLDRLARTEVATTAIVEAAPGPPEGAAPPRVLASWEAVNTAQFDVLAEAPGLLIRSEAWAPGWTATVDGRRAEVVRVDCALQGVWLEAGDRAVRFVYAPTGFMVGRWVSLAAGLLVAGFLIFSARAAWRS